MQTTLMHEVQITGVGLHSGENVTLHLCPAEPDTGLVFLRTDLSPEVQIPALWNALGSCERSTRLIGEGGAQVETVEHLLSALSGLGVNNCLVKLNAAELPICDGSAEPFVSHIIRAGILKQNAALKTLYMKKAVRVEGGGGSSAELAPAKTPSWSFELDYEAMGLARQSETFDPIQGSYIADIAPCRTFGFKSEIDALRAKGLIGGASLDCAVLFDDGNVVNEKGLRHPLEPVRHKILDAIGDIALIGARIHAAYHGIKAGHALNAKLVQAVMNDPSSYILQV